VIVVEGAQAFVDSADGAQGDAAADDIDDVIRLANLFPNRCPVIQHGAPEGSGGDAAVHVRVRRVPTVGK
jgi:hypothetical protein